MAYYRRRGLTDEERFLAGAIGVAAGAITFYLARLVLQREPLSEGPPPLPAIEGETTDRAERASEPEAAEPRAGPLKSQPEAEEEDRPSR